MRVRNLIFFVIKNKFFLAPRYNANIEDFNAIQYDGNDSKNETDSYGTLSFQRNLPNDSRKLNKFKLSSQDVYRLDYANREL